MKFLNKCFAVAMSALFAVTPVVPANAMPIFVSTVQPVATTGVGEVQLVRDNNRAYWRKGKQRFHYSSRSSGRDARRYSNRDYRGDRRHYRDRHVGWRGDRGDRNGWYRGHRGYRSHRSGYRYHNGFWFPLAAFGVGTIVGGAISNDRNYGNGGGSHVNWCANRYRSYRASDNTYQPYNGGRRQCISPYS